MRHAYSVPIAAVMATLAAGACWIWLAQTAPRTSRSRPNVVLISLDTTRADHLSCHGYPRHTSPNLERFAAGGVCFANARSQIPWTLPGHMSLFTSLLPSHCRINELSAMLSPDIPTLAETLAAQGYHTAGLVNDGFMKSIWGFNRGFKDWEEFSALSPEGDCVHLTDEALQWLAAAPREPFFLFLHYYDPHAPYEPPEEFRQRFGSALSGPETLRLLRNHLDPAAPFGNQDLLTQLMGSYDGEIAWLDQELGRLFAALPQHTLVVIFSDHGEAFKEHGWLSHGATLYDEVLHVPLLVRLKGSLPEGLVVEDPVMLLDVAPTVLNLCGVPAPAHYEGLDLAPTWLAGRLPERPVLAETQSRYVGQALKMVLLNDWKLIRSVLDGREELYRLPDEQTNLCEKESRVRDLLSARARQWVAEDDFWMVYAYGPGEFTAGLTLRSGQFLTVVPFPVDHENLRYNFEANYRSFQWRCVPGERTKGLLFQLSIPNDTVHFDVRIDGKLLPEKVFTGNKQTNPGKVPFDLVLNENDATDPVIDKPFCPDKPGFYIFRHRGRGSAGTPATAATLDDATIRQLRSLGYLR